MAPIKGDDGLSGIPVPSPGTFGVLGDSNSSYGVAGTSGFVGVYGTGPTGVMGQSTGVSPYTGVQGYGYYGVIGDTLDGAGLVGRSTNVGVYASNFGSGRSAYLATASLAADFYGDVYVRGILRKNDNRLLIDHPLDPANKYLSHSSVESSDQKNIYDGITTLDGNGEALVELPEWFSALNRDFRYQLTCLGKHAAVFVAQKIKDNRFRIAGGSPDLEVSWQVTGIRQDPWANANPLIPEEEKPEKERGTFLHPEVYGQPEEKSVQWARYSKPPELPVQLRDLAQPKK